MPGSDEQESGGETKQPPFAEVWADYVRRIDEASSAETAASCRRQFLDELSANLDAQMRTPEFLAAMKQNLDAMIRAGKTLKADNEETPASQPSPSNAELLVQLLCIEERMATRLANSDQRLADISQQLDETVQRLERIERQINEGRM